MQIIDNVLSPEDYQTLWTTMVRNDFPWYFGHFKVKHYKGDTDDGLANDHPNNCQMNHYFHRDDTVVSDYWDLTKRIRDQLNASAYIGVRANMTMATERPMITKMHTDCPEWTNTKTAIYYVNDNDGYTKFETGEIVESVGNRLVIFDGNVKHCGSTHTNQKYRIVINFNYYSTFIENFQQPEEIE